MGNIVIGVLRVNSIKGRVVTKAMLGRLSGNSNVLDHFIRGNRFEETYDLWTRGRPLKLPILNDHVRRQPSEVYPKSAHVRVCYFG